MLISYKSNHNKTTLENIDYIYYYYRKYDICVSQLGYIFDDSVKSIPRSGKIKGHVNTFQPITNIVIHGKPQMYNNGDDNLPCHFATWQMFTIIKYSPLSFDVFFPFFSIWPRAHHMTCTLLPTNKCFAANNILLMRN